MSHATADLAKKKDNYGGSVSYRTSIQNYSLNTSLGAMHNMSRLNNEMSYVEDTASGSFGVVRKGVFDLDRQFYAIKETKRIISGEGDLEKQLQEVYALSACNHPNILRYFDGWVENKAVHVRTEWVSGGSVANLHRPFSEELLRSFIHQIASALHWLCCHHCAHRDVKPENILARRLDDGTYSFKLGDFGLARPFSHHGEDTGEHFAGTNDDDGDRRYLCPEALELCDCVPISGEADVYALGASCVELMGGDPSQVRNGCFTGMFDSYSTKMQHLVRWMTKPNPKERPDAFTVALFTLDSEFQTSGEFGQRQAVLEQLRQSIDAIQQELDEESSDSETSE